MAVVLIIKMQYGLKFIPMVICNIYFGVLKIKILCNLISFAEIMAQLRHVGLRAEMW